MCALIYHMQPWLGRVSSFSGFFLHVNLDAHCCILIFCRGTCVQGLQSATLGPGASATGLTVSRLGVSVAKKGQCPVTG